MLKALVFAFGMASGTFSRATAGSSSHGWTVNPANAGCRCDDYNPDDFRAHAPDRGYDPYPVALGLDDNDPDLAFYGYEDARNLGNIMQEAIAELYHRNYITGYRSKLETEFRLNPAGAIGLVLTTMPLQMATTIMAQFIAETLRELVNESLATGLT